MNNLNINTGEIRLTINDDENRVLAFNPEDILFVERFFRLVNNFSVKEKEITARLEIMAALDNETVDGNIEGLPSTIPERIDLLKEICNYFREQIDLVFGEGVSKVVFGEAQTLNMFEQFFDGILPFVEASKKKRIGKYTRKAK